jgi:hypothetical protein
LLLCHWLMIVNKVIKQVLILLHEVIASCV